MNSYLPEGYRVEKTDEPEIMGCAYLSRNPNKLSRDTF
jgi:hypothetical protein